MYHKCYLIQSRNISDTVKQKIKQQKIKLLITNYHFVRWLIQIFLEILMFFLILTLTLYCNIFMEQQEFCIIDWKTYHTQLDKNIVLVTYICIFTFFFLRNFDCQTVKVLSFFAPFLTCIHLNLKATKHNNL